ncbi:MAG: hypothetical protein ACTSQE_07455 [Candidatus Heimdallarchaeaceae archaeon]
MTSKEKEQLLSNLRSLYKKHPSFRKDIIKMAEKIKGWPNKKPEKPTPKTDDLKDNIINSLY